MRRFFQLRCGKIFLDVNSLMLLHAAAFILAPAFFATFKYANVGLNADIVLNQIMAAHNVTLFYWGQNRLLNVMPFLLQLAPWPLPALFLTLFVAALSFFAVVWLCALFSAKFAEPDADINSISFVYIITALACCLFFKQGAWVEVCLWHFEYSLAAVLILLNILAVYFGGKILGACSFITAFIALGINPALILLLAPMLLCKSFLKRAVTIKDCVCIFCWSLFFVFWVMVGKAYGQFDDYSTLVFSSYSQGMEKFIVNIFSEYLYADRLMVFGALALLAELFRRTRDCSPGNALTEQIAVCAGLCAFFYVSVVACIRWYHMNQCGPRYFIFVIYIAIFVLSLRLWRLWTPLLKTRAKWLAPCILAATCCYFYPSAFNLEKSAVYNECNEMLSAGDHLYAGDYWKIWACVSRDMNRGHNSFALGYRSESDKKGVENVLAETYARRQAIEIHCLAASIQECRKQLESWFLSYNLNKIEKLNEKTLKLTLEHVRQKTGD